MVALLRLPKQLDFRRAELDRFALLAHGDQRMRQILANGAGLIGKHDVLGDDGFDLDPGLTGAESSQDRLHIENSGSRRRRQVQLETENPLGRNVLLAPRAKTIAFDRKIWRGLQ